MREKRDSIVAERSGRRFTMKLSTTSTLLPRKLPIQAQPRIVPLIYRKWSICHDACYICSIPSRRENLTAYTAPEKSGLDSNSEIAGLLLEESKRPSQPTETLRVALLGLQSSSWWVTSYPGHSVSFWKRFGRLPVIHTLIYRELLRYSKTTILTKRCWGMISKT